MSCPIGTARSESVPDFHGTSDVWQQILALDTRFAHLRPSMYGDSSFHRALYLRRRHQLSKEQSHVTQFPEKDYIAQRDLYKTLREQILAAKYGQAPSLRFSASYSCSAEQASPRLDSISDSHCVKFADDESCPSLDHSVGRATETLCEGYAFSGIEHIFDHHKAAVNRLRFANNDNTRLAMASADGLISICTTWPPNQPKRIIHSLFGGHQRGSSITDLAWSLSNESLVSTASDGTVCLWDTTWGRLIRVYSAEAIGVGPALVCTFQPQNYNLLVVGGVSGSIQTINLSTGKPIKKGRDQIHSNGFKAYKLQAQAVSPVSVSGQGCVTALTFEAATGKCLWVGTDRGVIQAYASQPETGKLVRTYRLNLRSLCTSTDITDCPDNLDDENSEEPSMNSTIGNIQRKQPKFIKRFAIPHHNSLKFPSVTSLTAHSWLSREASDSYLLANVAQLGLILFQVSASSGTLSLKRRFPITHEPPDPHLRRPVRLIHSCLAPLASFRSGACAVTASEDSNVYVFDVLHKLNNLNQTTSALPPGLVTVLQGHMSPVLDVAIAWDESVLASSDESGSVIIWRREFESTEVCE